MKLIGNNTEVETVGVTRRTDFKIKASAKAFKILSAGYTNKIRAFIREIGCNALDAHNMNGFQGKFQVKLPSRLDLTCSVRDFGPGLSVEDVEGLYTTLFESTKTENNNDIGCMGLGSKSPFSYTDQFNVISRFEGMKHTFALYLDGEGYPGTSLISSVPTDEPSGLEVSIPVDYNDIHDFQKEAAYVYSWFDNPPEILNCPDFALNVRKYVYETDEFAVSGSLNYFGVLMGNIFYPIDRYNLSSNNEHLRRGMDFNLILKMPNGSCDFTASREALSFDPITRKNVQEHFERAIEHLRQMGEDSFGVMNHTDLTYVEEGRMADIGLGLIYDYIRKFLNTDMFGKRWGQLTMINSNHREEMIKAHKGHTFHIKKYGMSVRQQNVDRTAAYRGALFKGFYVGHKHDVEKVRRHMFHNQVQESTLVTYEYWRSVLCRSENAIIVADLPPQLPREKADRKKVEKRGDHVYFFEDIERFEYKLKNGIPTVDVDKIEGRVPLVYREKRELSGRFSASEVKEVCRVYGNKAIAICHPSVYEKFLEIYPDTFFDPRGMLDVLRKTPIVKQYTRRRGFEKWRDTYIGMLNMADRFGLTEVDDMFRRIEINCTLKGTVPEEIINLEKHDYPCRQKINRVYRLVHRLMMNVYDEEKKNLPKIEKWLLDNSDCDDDLRYIIEEMRDARVAATVQTPKLKVA